MVLNWSAAPARPAPIRSNDPGGFAHGVLTRRNPALIEQVAASLPYGPSQRRALERLAGDVAAGVVQPLPEDAPDAAQWAAWGAGHYGRPWLDAPFLWAESFFYRRLLDAVDYDSPGPWLGVDPFGPAKAAELDDTVADAARIAVLADLDAPDRAAALLQASLWGNQADLGFRVSARQAGVGALDAAGLLADDSDALWQALTRTPPGTVCLVADNAGGEVLADLVLVDHLLDTGLAERVALHLKPVPYYVSDATVADVVETLRRMTATGGALAVVAARLRAAAAEERLALRRHAFYASPLTYGDLPADLAGELAAASLVILKGDLNYRRLVGDLQWAGTEDFAAVVSGFPAPVASLRTLKSETVVGLDAALVASLDESEPSWRVSGRHATIQVAGTEGVAR